MTESVFTNHYLVSREDKEPFTKEDFDFLSELILDEDKPHLPLTFVKGFQAIALKDKKTLLRLEEDLEGFNALGVGKYKLWIWAFLSVAPRTSPEERQRS